MSLRDRILNDTKEAMRAKERDRLKLLRSLSAAIKQKEVDDQTTLGDAEITAVVEKQVKQRRDAEEQFREGGREDLAEQEARQAEILAEYLPEALDPAELDQLIDQAIESAGARSMQDMGKVMGALKPQVQGRADMSEVSNRVKSRLGS